MPPRSGIPRVTAGIRQSVGTWNRSLLPSLPLTSLHLPQPHNPTGPAASLLNDGTVDVGQADEDNGFFDASVPTGVRSIDFRARMRLSNGQTSDWSETATIRFDTA